MLTSWTPSCEYNNDMSKCCSRVAVPSAICREISLEWPRTTVPVRLLRPGRQCCHLAASAFREPSATCSNSLPPQRLLPPCLFSRWPHSLELPDFIREPTISAECLRSLLKMHLFARYYCIQRVTGSWWLLHYVNLLTYLLKNYTVRHNYRTLLHLTQLFEHQEEFISEPSLSRRSASLVGTERNVMWTMVVMFCVWFEQLMTEMLTLTSCTRRATDSIDKRFCFDVIVQDRSAVLRSCHSVSLNMLKNYIWHRRLSIRKSTEPQRNIAPAVCRGFSEIFLRTTGQSSWTWKMLSDTLLMSAYAYCVM